MNIIVHDLFWELWKESDQDKSVSEQKSLELRVSVEEGKMFGLYR